MEKKTLYTFCEGFVNDRIARISKAITDIEVGLSSETKSSAGDKHETGRAMLQLEREKAGQQLAQAEQMKSLLTKVPLEGKSKNIGLGSMIRTSGDGYFLAISAGKYADENGTVFCISLQTPIGKLLLGKTVGDTILFRGKAIEILEIE